MDLSTGQAGIVTDNLRAALRYAARLAEPQGEDLAAAAGDLPDPGTREPHPALPRVGERVSRDLVVGEADTAAAMGHPDGSVTVLGSPRLALWFEVVSCDLLLPPGQGPTTVGCGILVHHLGPASVGEAVTVEVAVHRTDGRRIVFDCTARVGDRLVGVGTHQRSVLDPP
ncbi:MAG: thioesterase family protein [Marmoricola sp.]